MSRHHLLLGRLSGGGLAPPQRQLCPRDGHRGGGDGPGAGGCQGHQDGRADPHRQRCDLTGFELDITSKWQHYDSEGPQITEGADSSLT